MDKFFGIGFIILCLGISVSLIVAVAGIRGYIVNLTKEKLEVAPAKDDSKLNDKYV